MSEQGEGRGRLRRLLELFALTGFAIVQPVLDVTGRSPDFFLFRRPSTLQMWALLLIVVLVPPLAAWLAEILVGLVNKTAERALHLVNVAGLLGAIAVQVGKHSGHYGRRLAAVALVAGIALAVLLARSAAVRQVLLYASPAPLVFVLIFALTAPAGALLRPAKAGPSTAASAHGKPPVVLLILDEFPTRALLDEHGVVDKRLFPNFARLAGTSTWFPNATGVSGFTPFAVPPILTGKFPRAKVAPAYVEYPDNLFTMLGDSYRMNAYESISLLCPERYCTNVAAGRATGLGPLLDDTIDVAREVVSPRRPKHREGEEFEEQPGANTAVSGKGELDVMFRVDEGKRNQPERMTGFLGGIGVKSAKPSLNFLHILLPHVPFKYLPDGMTYGDHPLLFPLGRLKAGDNFRRNTEPGAIVVQEQRLIMQAIYVDALLGEMIDRMQETGVWDDALVVTTADHGTGFTPGQLARHFDADNQAELAYVPLFVKQPRQRQPKVDERNAMNVDILPTIADVIDVPLPFKVEGMSLLGTPRPTMAKQWYDTPGQAKPFDGAQYAARVRTGLAPPIARPAQGPDGMFALGPLRDLVGKKVADLTAGPAAPGTAKSLTRGGWNAVNLKSGGVPALLWGELNGVATQPTWLAISLNGTIAGTARAAPDGDGHWHFVGVVNDKHFKDGANDVRLFVVTGTTLHEVRWVTT